MCPCLHPGRGEHRNKKKVYRKNMHYACDEKSIDMKAYTRLHNHACSHDIFFSTFKLMIMTLCVFGMHIRLLFFSILNRPTKIQSQHAYAHAHALVHISVKATDRQISFSVIFKMLHMQIDPVSRMHVYNSIFNINNIYTQQYSILFIYS